LVGKGGGGGARVDSNFLFFLSFNSPISIRHADVVSIYQALGTTMEGYGQHCGDDHRILFKGSIFTCHPNYQNILNTPNVLLQLNLMEFNLAWSYPKKKKILCKYE
jgi:hypothetical protein